MVGSELKLKNNIAFGLLVSPAIRGLDFTGLIGIIWNIKYVMNV
jgi:hypothetical protein